MAGSWRDSDLEQLETALLIVTSDRRIAYVNPAARRLFGVASGTLEGSSIERLVVAERRGELRNLEEVLKGGSARRVRSVVRREDGGRVDVTMTIEPSLDELGRVEAARIRYEVLAGSGRMSSSPDFISDPRNLSPQRLTPASAPRFAGPRPDRDGPDHPRTLAPGLPSAPAAPMSGPRTAPASPVSEIQGHLAQLERQLEWLEQRLSQPASVAALDDPRERARALMVVAEAREQLREALEQLKSGFASVPPLPAPPKLPRL